MENENNLSHKWDGFSKWEWTEFMLYVNAVEWNSDNSELEFYWAVEWFKDDFFLKFEQSSWAYLKDAIVYAIHKWKTHTIWHRSLILEWEDNKAKKEIVLWNISSMTLKKHAEDVYERILSKIA